MKKILILLVIGSFLGCKHKGTSEGNNSIAENIAQAHGLEDFEKIRQISFTFNVRVDDSLRTSRSWTWNPHSGAIRLTEGDISRTYVKDEAIAPEEKELDQKFINDSYWLFFPFQLVWSDARIQEEKEVTAPISNQSMDKLIVSYPEEGGYTPGDTYEIFYKDDLIIREWIYRSADGNREMPTTWEGYEDFDGIKIATSHKSPDGKFELFFTDIVVDQ